MFKSLELNPPPPTIRPFNYTHYIILQVCLLRNDIWDSRSVPLFGDADKEQTHTKKAICLARWINTQEEKKTTQQLKATTAASAVRLRTACWRDSHAVVANDVSTQVDVERTFFFPPQVWLRFKSHSEDISLSWQLKSVECSLSPLLSAACTQKRCSTSGLFSRLTAALRQIQSWSLGSEGRGRCGFERLLND